MNKNIKVPLRIVDVDKEIDKTVDLLQKIMERTERLFRGYEWKDCICSCDGTSIVLEK